MNVQFKLSVYSLIPSLSLGIDFSLFKPTSLVLLEILTPQFRSMSFWIDFLINYFSLQESEFSQDSLVLFVFAIITVI
jgi:hypothetical protein